MLQGKNGIIFFHPGEILKEFLQDRNIKQNEFAERCDITEKHLSEIINGKASVSTDMAIKIGTVLSENYKTWMNLQKEYDVQISEQERDKEFVANKDIIKLFPLADMIKYKLIKDVKAIEEKGRELLNFFRIANITDVQTFPKKYYSVMYRKISFNGDITEESQAADAVLFRWSDIIAEKRKPELKYSKKEFLNAIENIRARLSLPFNDLVEYAKNECEKAGVIFIITPKITHASASGLSYLNSNKTPIILLTDRNKCIDTFWFSFFHEACHVLNHISESDLSEDMEKEANNYAKEILISSDKWNEFVNSRFNVSPLCSKEFSSEMNLPVDFVIGRLQNEGRVPYTNKAFSSLKSKLCIDDVIDYIN